MKKTFVFFIVLLLLVTGCAEAPTPKPTSLPEPTSAPTLPDILPHSLYYLDNDASGLQQIVRLERDGQTLTQITAEAGGVDNFDLSPADGRIIYTTANTIIIADANGENPQIVEENLLDTSYPIWSSDGTKVAYKVESVAVLYDLETGVKENLFVDAENERTWFSAFSPDDSKLAFRKFSAPSAPGGAVYIYDLDTRSISELGLRDSCYNDSILWASPDALFCYGNSFIMGAWPGLRRINLPDSSVDRLIFSETLPPYWMVDAPRQNEDGSLHYLYGEVVGQSNEQPPYTLVRSAGDGITDRAPLRDEKFMPDYTKWTPNGEALLIEQNGQLLLVPTDATQPILTVMENTANIETNSLEWGP